MLKHIVILGIMFILVMGVASLYTNQFDVFIEFLKLIISTGKELASWIVEKGIPLLIVAIQKAWAVIAEITKNYGG